MPGNLAAANRPANDDPVLINPGDTASRDVGFSGGTGATCSADFGGTYGDNIIRFHRAVPFSLPAASERHADADRS